MKYRNMKLSKSITALLLCMFAQYVSIAQGNNILINLSGVEGLDLTPENVFSYELINNTGSTKDVVVKGTIKYRNSMLSASYTYNTRLVSGRNYISKDNARSAIWTFSESAFWELFNNYGKMPHGTYEYCITVQLTSTNPEYGNDNVLAECMYHTSNDIFLINLIEPEDNAKIYELYPMFSWVVNYPFASQLTYRIRVAPLQEGQNNENAINRNNPVYQDKNILATTTTYPVTAKMLEKFKPYVWTVDAYFKGILLGGASPWRFTIIEDTLLKAIPAPMPYVDIRIEKGQSLYYSIGDVKLKYVLEERMNDTLKVVLKDNKADKQVNISIRTIPVRYGDNRIDFSEKDLGQLKHIHDYTISLVNTEGTVAFMRFKYLNPLYLNNKND